MAKTLLFAVVLLFAAAWLQAQDASQSGSSETTTAASGQRTLQGCLQGSDGNYTLTDRSGRTYQLGGDTAKPAAYVGREVQVTTSTPASIAIAYSAGAEESGAQAPTLTVEHVKYVSGTCQALQ